MKEYGILMPPRLRRKPAALLNAIRQGARRERVTVSVFRDYKPCAVLILYGWGGAAQQKAIKAHNGPYVAFDLGYWDRDGFSDRKWRVSINGFHCPERIMQGPRPKGRRDSVLARPEVKTDGHILLIGNGPKSQKVVAGNWSVEKCAELRKVFPGKKILFRPKPQRLAEKGVMHDGLAEGDLGYELSRASLVVCRHSNVAVDACRAGVPAVCDDGAGAAIYPTLDEWERQPTQETRQEFLDRLAYWQWSMIDIRKGRFWPWLEKELET